MNTRHCRAISAALLCLYCVGFASPPAATLQFESSEGFVAGPWTGNVPFAISGALTAAVVSPGYESNQALEIAGSGWLLYKITPEVVAAGSVIWLDYWIKTDTAADSVPPAWTSSQRSAEVYSFWGKEGEDRRLWVSTLSPQGEPTWFKTTYTANNTSSPTWFRLSFRLDYTHRRADVYVDGKVLAVALGFVGQESEPVPFVAIGRGGSAPFQIDGIFVGEENPLFVDSAKIGLPDEWLRSYNLPIATGQRDADPDRDGVSNVAEYAAHTRPISSDSDGDGMPDNWELLHGLNPTLEDSQLDPDTDGLTNIAEYRLGTDPWRENLQTRGAVAMEIWNRIPPTTNRASSLRNVTALSRFGGASDETLVLHELRQVVSGKSDYGARVRGFIEAPADGKYEFWIAADDNAELWLSRDESPFQRKKLAWTVSSTGPDEFTKFSTQHSLPVELKKGENYYFEIVYKQGKGADHLSVQWQTPEGAKAIVPGDVLKTFFPRFDDLDGDGMPDDWERRFGLDTQSAAGSQGAYGDPDGDGVDNLSEYQAGLSPSTANDKAPGGVFLEEWGGIGGLKISDLTNNKKFSFGADRLTYLTKLEGTDVIGFGSGARIRGYVLPASTGSYQFAVAGDENVELWISPDDQPFNRVKAAWTLTATKPGVYTRFASQRSVQFPLEQGKRYYFEVLHKQSNGVEHFSVAWRADSGAFSVITSEHLEAFTPQVNDRDSDGLPDGWEARYGIDTASASASNGAYQQRTRLEPINNLTRFQAGLSAAGLTGRVPGLVVVEEWGNIYGKRVWNLTTNNRFGGRADKFAVLRSLDVSGQFTLNSGARARGFLSPDITGDYEFWIAGDDAAEFWLSADDSVTRRTKIAWTDGFTALRAYDVGPTQRSAIIHLEKGRDYYFDVLTKQGTGESHFSVAWKAPGKPREVIGAAHLKLFVPNADDLDADGIPDEWELAHGLLPDTADGDDGMNGDFDRDRVSNLDEYKLGLDPLIADTDHDGMDDGDELAALENPTAGPVAFSPGVPAPWLTLATDPGEPGSWSLGAKLLVKASESTAAPGVDVSGLVYQRISGDFVYTAEIILPDSADQDIEGGLMVRASTDANAAFLAVTKGKDHGWILRYRASPNAPAIWDRVSPNLGKFTHVQIRRSGNSVGVYGRTSEGVLRPLAEYPVPFATSEAIVGHVVWGRPYAAPAAVLFVPSDLQRDGFATSTEAWQNGFDSVKWMGEWDGAVNPVGPSAPLARQPSMQELAAAQITVASSIVAPGSVAQIKTGPWLVEGDNLTAQDRRGELAWTLPTSAGAIYLLELSVREGIALRNLSSTFPLKAFVDGEYVGTRVVSVDPHVSNSGLWFTPWLAPGDHEIRLIWDGAASATHLSVNAVRLHLLSGPDADTNGIADWMDRRLKQFNGVDKVRVVVPILELPASPTLNPEALVGTYNQLAASVPWTEFVAPPGDRNAAQNDVLSSVVSPMPLEGSARWPGLTRLYAQGQSVLVQAGAGYRWFANVPLQLEADTALDFLGENGGVRQSLTVRWDAYDPFQGGTLHLVGGAILRIATHGAADKQAVVTLDGVALDASSPTGVQIPFVAAGTHTLKVAGGTVAQPVVTQIVVDVTVPPTLWPGLFTRESIVQTGGFTPTIRFEGDPRLGLITFRSSPKTVVWAADDNVDRTVVARAAADGPVLGAVQSPGSKIYSTMDTYNQVVAVLPDGTREVETLVILSPRRPDYSVRLEIFVAGVLFTDGTRVKDLNYDDFDELGQARVTFLWPAGASTSVCHRTHLIYQGKVISTK